MPNNYGAIELGICENTSLALNEALGVSTGFKPSEWADNISGLIAPTVHLAEGAVASFPNGLAVPFVSVTADINAVQSGSGTPSPSNVRAISGFSSVNVTRAGKNLIGTLAKTGVTINTSGEEVSNTNFDCSDYLYFKAGTYSVSCEDYVDSTTSSAKIRIGAYSLDDKTFISPLKVNISATATIGDITTASFTLTTDCYIKVAFNKSRCKNLQVEVEGTAIAYEPYNGEVKNIPLNQTVYGGRLNVTTGELTITHAYYHYTSCVSIQSINQYNIVNIVLKSGSSMFVNATAMANYLELQTTTIANTQTNGIFNNASDMFARLESSLVGTTVTEVNSYLANNPIDVVVKLATPTTVQLTPTQIEGLLGTNNVWADTGDIEVVYKGKSVRNTLDFTSAVTSGWTDTNGERDMLTITAITDAVITFNQSATGVTNCGSNHGYEKITVNGVEKWRRTMPTNTSQTFNDIPVINLNKGDVMALTFGFTNSHSNINMNFVGGKIDIVGGVSFRGITGVTNSSTTIV